MEIKVDLFHGGCDMTISKCSTDANGTKRFKLRTSKLPCYADEMEFKISETENVVVITLDGAKELYRALGVMIEDSKNRKVVKGVDKAFTVLKAVK
jgi:hypothetical protein